MARRYLRWLLLSPPVFAANPANDGATACFVYFLIETLYRLGRTAEADAILSSMLRGFETDSFRGRGFPVDGYLAQPAALTPIQGTHAAAQH